MNNKKIIFMGSPKIASDYLEALIKSNFIISAVFSPVSYTHLTLPTIYSV